MKWTKTKIVAAGSFQLHILRNHLDNVEASTYFINKFSGKPSHHPYHPALCSHDTGLDLFSLSRTARAYLFAIIGQNPAKFYLQLLITEKTSSLKERRGHIVIAACLASLQPVPGTYSSFAGCIQRPINCTHLFLHCLVDSFFKAKVYPDPFA